MNVTFDTSIYSPAAIWRAIADYGSIAKITMTSENENCICKFWATAYPQNETVLEFCNYVLDLTVNMSTKV